MSQKCVLVIKETVSCAIKQFVIFWRVAQKVIASLWYLQLFFSGIKRNEADKLDFRTLYELYFRVRRNW